MVYKYKTGARIPVAAQVAGEVCEELENNGMLTPHNLVEVSRPKDAPLHKAFEWDDAVAAERYREVQAGNIIRVLVKESEDNKTDEPTRAFFPVVTDGGSRMYRSVDVIMRDANSREALLEGARRELASFQRKYSNLKELSNVFAAIEQFTGSLFGEESAA